MTDLEDLDEDITEEEVKRAILELVQDKAPGPDGSPIFFYKRYWETIRTDFMKLIQEINQGTTRLDRLNYACIVLIPKEGAERISQYRSISLLNCLVKIILKVLACRLAPWLKELVGDYQTGLIKEKNIIDGVIIRHEVIH